MITILITLSRKVNPLGMSKLVSHKVQICFSSERKSDESDHFVECHGSDSLSAGICLLHMINFLIKKPHRHRLIAHNSLVMTLSICDRLFIIPSIGQVESNIPHLPVPILHFFQVLDPHIWQEHTQPEVKANTSMLDFPAECRHSWHFFGYCDSVRI